MRAIVEAPRIYPAVVERIPFAVNTRSGTLVGWIMGEGPRVLAIHGGPGLNYDYLDDAVTELADHYQVATFQQRGMAPSTEDGEFTIAEAVDDIAAVMNGLGWESAYLVGHSWGGHLVLHAALAIPEMVAGVLSVDPLGAVGDGGAAAFGAELRARVPERSRDRLRVLSEKDEAGVSTPEEDLESFSLLWPSYFADPAAAPPMPPIRFSQPSNRGLWDDLAIRLPELESSLPSITVPVGVLVGELSPMPLTAGTDSAARIPGAWSHVEPGAGHFVWHESPGCLVAAMDRLVAGSHEGDG
jgi:pimeloyl-ACP methyl ester carboxylesterase